MVELLRVWMSWSRSSRIEEQERACRKRFTGNPREALMPMYDYTCLDCGKESLIIVTLKQHEQGEVQCPACGSTKLQQHFSSFIAHTTKKS